MTYTVIVTRPAKGQLNRAADWIAEKAPEAAERWFNGFVAAISSLSRNPRRCGFAREHRQFPFELRELLYGRRRNYRAIFTIRGSQVIVIAIRHAAQAELTLDDIR
jgi:plasmid stabilization system protein ParE